MDVFVLVSGLYGVGEYPCLPGSNTTWEETKTTFKLWIYGQQWGVLGLELDLWATSLFLVFLI